MKTMVRRLRICAVLVPLLLASVLIGCEPGHTVVPAGGQEVHVSITAGVVHLQPATARAGDIYLVADTPGSVLLVRRQATAEGTPGPMSDDDLARLTRGDTQFTAIEGDYGTGNYGNVHKVTLGAGKYALITDAPEALAARGGGHIPPGSIAILQVQP